jgi:hypothetical protein
MIIDYLGQLEVSEAYKITALLEYCSCKAAGAGSSGVYAEGHVVYES